jgi:hypothetical protein
MYFFLKKKFVDKFCLIKFETEVSQLKYNRIQLKTDFVTAQFDRIHRNLKSWNINFTSPLMFCIFILCFSSCCEETCFFRTNSSSKFWQRNILLYKKKLSKWWNFFSIVLTTSCVFLFIFKFYLNKFKKWWKHILRNCFFVRGKKVDYYYSFDVIILILISYISDV